MRINEFKKVQEKDTKFNNYCVVFLSGVLSVFVMTGFSELVAADCAKCFGLGLVMMLLDMGWQSLKGNFDKIQKTERKEVNKKEA